LARSEPACGSRIPAPVLGRVEDAREPPCLLGVGAPRDDRRPDLHDAVRVEDAGGAVLRITCV